jgi:hypothetical protein
MATTNKLALLEAKLNEAQAAYDQEAHHSTGARIAFVAAGNLTRGAYHKLLNHRETLSKLGKRLEKLRLSVKLAKGTPITLHDVEMARMYLPLREYQEFSGSNPVKTVEMVADFVKGFWRGPIFVDYGKNVAVREKGSKMVYMTSDFHRLMQMIS